MRSASRTALGAPISLPMALIGAIRQRLFLLARSEEGIALPTAVMAMIVSFAFAGIAVMASVDAQQGTTRDSHSKDAIAAADAGANVALTRLNHYHETLFHGAECVGPAGEELTATNGWCPATPAEHVGGATFTYQLSAFEPEEVEEGIFAGPVNVVAIGTADGVSRRIEVGLYSNAGEKVFANEKLVGQNDVHIKGNAYIETDIGTNGNIEKEGSTAEICGNLRHGIGHTAPEPDCENEVTEANKNLPQVEVPEDIATNNENCRLEHTCIPASKKDVYQTNEGNSKKEAEVSKYYDVATRTIHLTSNSASLTMGGATYFICQLEITGGELIMAAGEDVESHIYFDTPEDCGLQEGEPQIKISGNGKISSTGYNPPISYNLPILYLIGSTSVTTSVELTGTSSTIDAIIYAPNSEIKIAGNTLLTGMAAGKTITVEGNATITSDPNIHEPDPHYEAVWARTHYVECTGAGASTPDEDC